MTGTRVPRPPWPWADPFWWARKQFEVARLMMRLTESVIDASVSSVLGGTGRTAARPAPSTSPGEAASAPAPATPMPATPALTVTAPAPAEQASTATVTAPAPGSAPVPVPHFATERAAAGELLVSVPGEAAERAPSGEPPVPGWDGLTLGSIRARLRRLSEQDLVALRRYEEGHAARPDVLSMLTNRLAKVRSED
jgi:hypothetical protein